MMSKYKIVVLGSAHPLRGGGISTFNERLAAALQEAGHEVEIFSFSLQYPSFLFPGKSQFTDEPAPKGLTIRTCVNSVNPINWLKIGLSLKKIAPDFIVCRFWLPFMGPCLGSILHIAKKNRQTKIVGILDNVIPHEKRPGDFYFTKFFLKSLDKFIVMSKSVGRDLEKFLPNPVFTYSPHPVYDTYGEDMGKTAARNKLGLIQEEKYLLFFGFIREYKGLELLLQAMASANVKALGVKLIVAGEYYGNQAYYEQLIDMLGVREQLVLKTNFIPNSEVGQYFSAADLVVQPYKTATQSGVSQIAFQYEKPMVVTNVGGLGEIVLDGKCGYVVEPNHDEIANAICDFYSNRNPEERFLPYIKEQKRHYQWGYFVENILS